MEHAAPEAFWVDKNRCRYTDEKGQTRNPTQSACPQALSAVKALWIAQSQGQKICTITKDNRETAFAKIPVDGKAGEEIRDAIRAGKEVTFHESKINAYGWSGYGYIITDPDTGAGSYLISGSGNGAILFIAGVFILGMIVAMIPAAIASGGAAILALGNLIALGVGSLLMGASMMGIIDGKWCQLGFKFVTGASLNFMSSAIIIRGIVALIGPASSSAKAGFLHLICGSTMIGLFSGFSFSSIDIPGFVCRKA